MRNTEPGLSPIVKDITRIVAAFIIIFGIYIVLHGHLTPGGGFPGGVILAAGLVLVVLAFGKNFSRRFVTERMASFWDSAGATGFLVIGPWAVVDADKEKLRMEVVDRESHPVHLTLRLPLYWLWLLWEIVKSNVVVARLIWSPSLPISPTVFQVPTSQKSQLGQVVYANSITLTPGTVSMTLENNQVRVHALTEDIAKDLQTGTMDRRVTALEGEG